MKVTKKCRNILFTYGTPFVIRLIQQYDRANRFEIPVDNMYFVSNNPIVNEIKAKGYLMTVDDLIECEIQFFERDPRMGSDRKHANQIKFILEYVVKDCITTLSEAQIRDEINNFVRVLAKWRVIT